MKHSKINKSYLAVGVFLSICVFSCIKLITPIAEIANPNIVRIKQSAEDAKNMASEILEKTSIQLADGLNIKLWATDSLAQDPIALSIDSKGRIYITSTNRQKNSEFDIRGHRNWMTQSISWQTVEEKRAFFRKVFDPKNSEENNWLKDLNEDGVHDWRDLTIEKDEIWRIEDTDNDGIADISSQVLRDFNSEITDVAGALLIRDNDAFVGIAPDLWRLQDTDNDGYFDKKTSLISGFGVHVAFGGHGMSGLIEGPDGKIYWGIGDIGASLVDQTGKKHHYPNQGIIVRCNPDGSNFEVFSRGHRNTHEFVFDEFGNLISSDNDGDQPGESERLVHIVEGSDSGWRANWQYGKYTDPKNNDYRVWTAEDLFKPRWNGQAAYIIPPIQNYHNGPTGMIYNPGTALSSEWKNKFFLVEFTGTPSRANIWSFGLKPSGASFKLDSEKSILKGILATGIRFGPEGSLYIADWINGWNTKDYGRIWKVDVNNNDLKELRELTKKYIQEDFTLKSESELSKLISFEDQRVRSKAQFELVTRGNKGISSFKKLLSSSNPQLARIHAIWGIGQFMENNNALGSNLVGLLNDSDQEVVAQTCKIIGQYFYAGSNNKLIELLKSESPRVRFYAAEALGRLEVKSATQPLITMLAENADEDVYLRHAAIYALARIGEEDKIASLYTSDNESLRLGAVLALRRMNSEKLGLFINDKSEYIVAEVARAINDDFSIEPLLPQLANLLKNKSYTSEPLLRRAINAALRVGGKEQLDLVLDFAKRNNVKEELRAEALATIGTWIEPSVLDRVDGRYRGVVNRNPEIIRKQIKPEIATFLNDKNSKVVASAIHMISNLGITDFNEELVKLFSESKNQDVMTNALVALNNLKYSKMDNLIPMGMEDSNKEVRTTALGMINDLDLTTETLLETTNLVLKNGSEGEQQKLISTLAKMPLSKTESIFTKLIGLKSEGKLPNILNLELEEAVENANSNKLKSLLAAIPKGETVLEQYKDALYGGNAREGRNLFRTHEAAQCTRCHVVNGSGGTVGPDLTNIASRLSREEILISMVDPSASLAVGYGSVNLVLKGGQEVFGILAKETDSELIITTSDAEPTKVAKARIESRENYPSGMPEMGYILSKREIRDLTEYVMTLK